MTSKKPSRRDIQREATHASVIEAARSTFFERGFEQTTISDIAREAGVSPGTVLNAAPSKVALLILVLDDQYKALQSELDRLEVSLSGAVSDRLLALITASLEAQAGYRELFSVAIGYSWLSIDANYEKTFDQLDRAWTPIRRIIEQGQSSGELRADHDPDEVLKTLQGIYLSVYREMPRERSGVETMARLLRGRVEMVLKGCQS